MKTLKRLFLGLLLLIVVLAVAAAINTFRQKSRQVEVQPLAKLNVDEAGVAGRLSAAVRIQTVSMDGQPLANADAIEALQAQLRQDYPKLHAALKLERIGSSLLYTWAGSDAKAQPMLLMAHQDVVPIAPGTEKDWTEPPFSGVIKDGYVWGRGSWDDKGNLISQMEAIEMLVASGYQPRRTIYLAYGSDEEAGGTGAMAIAKTLKDRGVRLEFVLDEGLLITEGLVPGLKAPAALVGVAEKGYVSLKLSVSTAPGHSSMPPAKGQSAIALLAGAVQRVDQQQMPGGLRGVAGDTFAALAPEMSGLPHVALTNLWLFGPLLEKQFEAGASTNAMLRTTTAPTIFNAGNKENVLPGRAEAVVNFRLLPGDTVDAVVAHVKKAANDERIEVNVLPGAQEASPVSPQDVLGYRSIERTVREVFPGTLVAPGLMIGAADARHYAGVSSNIYRFSPVLAKPEDLPRFHGTNERLSTANLADMVRFYHRLVSEAAK